jgi:hypothetical protein
MAVCALLRIVSYRPALCSALAFDDDPSLWCFCLPVTHESRIQSPELVHSWTPQHVYPGFHNCSRRSSSSSSYLGAIKSWQASSSDFLWPPLFLEFSNGLGCWYYTSKLSASLPGSLSKKKNTEQYSYWWWLVSPFTSSPVSSSTVEKSEWKRQWKESNRVSWKKRKDQSFFVLLSALPPTLSSVSGRIDLLIFVVGYYIWDAPLCWSQN